MGKGPRVPLPAEVALKIRTNVGLRNALLGQLDESLLSDAAALGRVIETLVMGTVAGSNSTCQDRTPGSSTGDPPRTTR